MKKEAAVLLYKLGIMHDRLDNLRERYKDGRSEQIQLTIDLFKVKIAKLHKQLCDLD
jgi:hypothetical protein